MDYKVALVEDEEDARKKFGRLITLYSKQNGIIYSVAYFKDAFDFLEAPHGSFDAVFLDIQMPAMNGFEVAKRLRAENENVLIVFVTNMAQYAIQGYEVNAYDYILKPLSKDSFFMKLDRITTRLRQTLDDSYVVISFRGWDKKVKIIDIYYIEVINHDLIFHFKNDEVRIKGTLSFWEARLSGHHFSMCNSCYLVNLKHIDEIGASSVIVDGQELRISRSKKKSFLEDFAKYAGGSE